MKADATITITPSQVQAWEREAAEMERQAGQLVHRAKAFRAKAKAGAFLLGIEIVGGAADGAEAQQPELKDLGLPEPHSPGNMTEAIAVIANANEKPLSKAAMKARLRTLGFPEDRLGNYFYTCVARLKGKRINVLPNGDIERIPQKPPIDRRI